ncbi:TPA_asm: hypothetical protein GND82_001529 [Salmonella enterica subsp. salamae serovar 60:g,m,t:z6]|uniref:Uncharacterized protein n=1 Tax=Salmonella enterica subsp. houtenae serovar 1,40:z4,z32:- TaxID=1967604 RepID=A0A730ZQR2_SALHO|nr:hypothetical protein [Salmonella bongori serovar 66:z65:-]HAE2266085.1 hypothetical protein [Salmonella enterica subsp. enterica serovar 1,9,12:-:-]HAE4188171.1 hypothetical protein [Salmonella enterica subsp. houtenae serovar 1,40:z4,z32:-]HAE7512703.1 hypothetical protein [Salmonella enterica subsp. salamae serovar 60:g,m,t:z6]HCM1942548.1 hypothetical protein [Salmonella enterica subsp. salamae serovar 30:g,m,s:e,n,x]
MPKNVRDIPQPVPYHETSYRRVGSHFTSCSRWFDKSPSWYRNMMMTRPERREVRKLLNQVVRGRDADGIAFPVSNKPFAWWW